MSVLSAIVNGITYSLDDNTYTYWTVDDGLGMSPMHRINERGPLQHGMTDRGYRLDPRNLRIILDMISDERYDSTSSGTDEWEEKRQKLLSIFKPTNDPIILKFEFNRATYYLDTYYVGNMSMPSADRMGWSQIAVVDLVAPDPTFYGANRAEDISLGGGANTMEVPTVIPMTVGGTTADVDHEILYYGTVDSYPIIRIHGPITSPIITNTNTNDKLSFSGVTIALNDYYEIDCRYGYKTIKNAAGTNKISDLTNDSDLATFRIIANPFANTDGYYNSFNVTGTSVTEYTIINIIFYDRYIGI